MSEKKSTTNILPKLEILIIGVLFIGFTIWAFSKCQRTKTLYEQQAARTTAMEEPNTTEKEKKITEEEKKEKETTQEEKKAEEGKKTTRPKTSRERYTPLYVSIDGLNVREEPKLNASVVAQLKLHEEVTFLNEITDFKQKINLGKVEAYEPWIKIRTRKGKSGWVYGAGVHYYKTETQGVQ